MMATHGGITDDLLARLAEDIETDEQMEALGRSLGVSHPAIRRYTETSRLEGRVTCRGTRDMLFDWRQTVVPTDQHPRLKQALIDAHLVMLAETHLEGASSSPDIFGKKISESLTVRQCREKLRHRYLDKLCKIQLKPWDKSNYAELKDLHTVVKMMMKDASGRDTQNKEELEGSVDMIFSTKVNGRLPSRILISAPAGVGKTTAVAKIAYDWAEETRESALEHLPLLFVVKFRNTSQRTSIGEAIKTQLLSDVADLTPEGIESFIRRNQGICHIILDGLDEYAGISSTSNIVSVIRCEEFPQSRVLVTTRPHLQSYFDQDDLPRAYTKMWIEGFSMESSREYIDRFFTLLPSAEKGGKLKEYLHDQPLINELVKTPLFCLLICHLWSEDQRGSDVSTQTDLFDSVNNFLMQHANARSGLTFTQKKLKGIVNKIGKVALYGLLDDAKKLIFTPQDFRRVPRILDKACDLGIVSKTTVPITSLPQSDETTSTQIEFYHKLAQEHSAGKFIASETWRILFRLRVSKLDRILRKINSNIGDYEQLIRFAAGTDRHLGIRIMEAILANETLEENERYRILLDCSSESKDSGGDMSSLVQRCVTAQSIILKSPTIYTVVGLQNLPKRLQREIRTMRFMESVLTTDVTRRMWSCLALFSNLNTINITESSLSFPSSLPKLSSFVYLSAKRMTPSCYKSVISSLSNARELNVSIEIEGTSNTFEITTNVNRVEQIVYRQHDISMINVAIQICLSQSLGEVNDLGLKSGGLALLFEDQSRNQHLLSISGDMGRYGDTMVDLFVKTTQLTYIHSTSLASTHLVGCITKCHLSSEMTASMWSCLRSFTSLNHLTISDSSLSFSLSPPALPSVTKLLANKLTSQCYQGLISSLPGLRDIDVQDVQARDDFVEFVESSVGLTSLQRLEIKSLDKLQFDFDNSSGAKITKCRLSSEMTSRLWTCVRSFTSLNHLTISDSSLIFPPSPPELPLVTRLSVERVASQSYKGLISSLHSLKEIDITLDDVEGDIAHITAVLRTGGQKLKKMYLYGPSSLSPERSRFSRETMRGLGLFIKEHTQNLKQLHLERVKCTDEDDLVYLMECCRHVKTMKYVSLSECGTTNNGRLHSHLENLNRGSSDGFYVRFVHDAGGSDRFWTPRIK